MTHSRGSAHIRLIAKELEEDGYSVILAPSPSSIPFDLKNYYPDLIATGPQGNLIVEVKTRGDSRSIERYKEIADEVSRHEGWRFMLSTIDEPYQEESVELKPELTPDSLQRALSKLEALLDSESFELAVPYLWMIYISAMRSFGRKQGLPMDATTDRSVINYMYTMGGISADEFEESKRFLDIRNKLLHTFDIQVSKSQVVELVNYTKSKLNEWSLASTPTENK